MEINQAALQVELQQIDEQAGVFTDADGKQTVDAVSEVVGQPPSSANRPEDIIGMLRLAVEILSPMFPSLRQVYTDETMHSIAAVAVPLADKHGFSLSNVFGRFQEEIQFAFVVVPVALATYQAVKHDVLQRDIDARMEAEAEAAKQAEEGGAGVHQ